MTTSVNSANKEQIIFNFCWEGPSCWKNCEVRVIDLLFENAKTHISVRIPSNHVSNVAQKLPFTCRKESTKDTHPESLRATIEQIKNLRLQAGFFEENPYQDVEEMNLPDEVRGEHALRSNSRVKLAIPRNLEPGQTYRLVMSSNGLTVKAQLVKDEVATTTQPITEENSLLTADQDELFQFLEPVLLPLINEKRAEFEMRLRRNSSYYLVDLSKLNFQQQPESTVLKDEIKKIKRDALKEITGSLRASKSQKLRNLQQIYERLATKGCFYAIGAPGLINIMRSSLMALMGNNIPAEVKELITITSNDFKDFCLRHDT